MTMRKTRMRMTMRKRNTIFTRMESEHLVTFWSPSCAVLYQKVV
jgi:hypothetical protein